MSVCYLYFSLRDRTGVGWSENSGLGRILEFLVAAKKATGDLKCAVWPCLRSSASGSGVCYKIVSKKIVDVDLHV